VAHIYHHASGQLGHHNCKIDAGGKVIRVQPRLSVDGVTVDRPTPPGVNSYGHYTAMQVRGGRTRGLDLHLARLCDATVEVFGQALDPGLVRAHLRHTLGDTADASVGVFVYDGPTVVVIARGPAPAPRSPQRLRSVAYQRPVAHVKHLGSFAQVYHGRRAVREGFDDALLTGPGGVISEAAIANIGFFDGAEIVWPDAPQLSGITMQLIERALPSRREPVRLTDLPRFAGAFVTNSHGVAAVGAIDDVVLPVDEERTRSVAAAYESAPWDVI
jgi:branched-subunit amino acid aminotransferase/4-amino-4-deoxychorismate lyase